MTEQPLSASGSNIGNPTATTTPPNNPRPVPQPDRATASSAPRTGITQPKPQALPKRTGPSSIIVSPRQKGNPVLNNIKNVPWEYGDIPADYVLGQTTCALFLSLKYHRLHPEYVYARIKGLQGKYALRIVLVMVDIANHEDPLRELSKTSLINNVTLILCWSSAEGGRYLELFKSYENTAPTSIKQHVSNAYADRLSDFVTTPRGVNKTDAVSLVSQFGSLRTAVNAPHEEVATIAGWGEKKVQRWCASVREPFRIERAAGRKGRLLTEQSSGMVGSRPESRGDSATPGTPAADADSRPRARLAEEEPVDEQLFVDDEEALAEAMSEAPPLPKVAEGPSRKRKPEEDPVGEGVMAALSKLRKEGG